MASAEYEVLTPERVSLQYDIAGIGSRGAAILIDSLLQGAAIFVLALGTLPFLVAAEAPLSGRGSNAALGAFAIWIAVLVAAIFVIVIGYFIFFELIWNGQTPGKRVLGLRVIRENGYPIRAADAVIRNLVRIVDAAPASYAIGLTSMLFSSRSKRLGDYAAGTIVIREGRQQPASVSTSPPVGEAGIALRPADATLIRDFLSRRASMEAAPRADLAQKIADAVAHRYGLQVNPDPETFLERLA
jgi:uncharacterized RDD family membrane protein YckC